MRLRALAAATLLAGATIAAAQTPVYRCGPDGREYSQQPCPGGSTFNAADPRDAEQRAQAQQAATLERARGDRLERERLAREAAAPSRAIALDAPRATPASKSSPTKRRKAAKPRDETNEFVAVETRKTRKR